MLELFNYDFMQRAFAAGILISIIAPLIGCFLVIRRYSLMADTLAHVSLVGVAVGVLSGWNPVITATGTSIIAAFCIEKLRNSKKIFGESVLALFLSGSLAVASVLISMSNGLNVNLFSYLFGSITTVSTLDLWYIAILGLLVLAILITLYKELFLISFDEELAIANGLNTRLYNLALIVLAAVTVSLSMRIVGILLIGALMVIPVVTAMQFGRSFKQTLVISVILSFISVVSGLFVSYYFNLASGGTIVVIALVLFLASFLFNKN
jgi:zinc transport system permease protein